MYYLEAKIVVGRFAEKLVMLPKMDLETNDQNLALSFRRRQFPIRLYFAMAFNKSQGQPLEKVGIYLTRPVFAHGQLYVALSRVRRWDSIKVQIVETNLLGKTISETGEVTTLKIIYDSIFRQLSKWVL